MLLVAGLVAVGLTVRSLPALDEVRTRLGTPDASGIALITAFELGSVLAWLVCRRYLSEESMRLLLDAVTEPMVSLPNDNEQEVTTALAA